MAWEWSHSSEAYYNARQQFEALDRKTRNIIAAEWLAAIPHPRFGISFSANLDQRKYERSLIRVSAWSDDKLNDYCWERIENLATCTNGGWKAWCCPFGCGRHMVPFDPISEDEPNPQDCNC